MGLGLTLFVTLAAIQTSINNEIKNSVPERAPSFFVLDIPREGAAKFTNMVKEADPNGTINLIPALRGTIIEYGGQRVDELEELPEGAWVLNGDRGLTYSPTVPKGSELVAGEWWPADYKGPALVSLDAEIAEVLDVGIGDSMTVSLLGVEVPAKIASLRTVNWENFGLNYVMVFSPGSLDAAPHNMVATLTVSKDAERKLAKALPPAFPSSSLIEVGEVTAQITTLLTQMAQAIAAAASIAILAGIAVLVGAIAAAAPVAHLRRGHHQDARRHAQPDIGRASDGIWHIGGCAGAAVACARHGRGLVCRGANLRLHLCAGLRDIGD